MADSGYEYVGSLFDGLDLSRPVTGEPAKTTEKTAQKQTVKSVKKPGADRHRSVGSRPRAKTPNVWSDRIPNADADYIIPDEAYDPDF